MESKKKRFVLPVILSLVTLAARPSVLSVTAA